jgi:hypothetical protein
MTKPMQRQALSGVGSFVAGTEPYNGLFIDAYRVASFDFFFYGIAVQVSLEEAG